MKLYKKDSKGKLRSLTIKAVGCTIVQTSGLIGGKQTETISQCEPKNVGRANATTAEEQAIKEAKAKFDDKLTKGYYNAPEWDKQTDKDKAKVKELMKL